MISHVEAEAKLTTQSALLTVIPSLILRFTGTGLFLGAPTMDDLKAEAKSQLEAIIKIQPSADRVRAHVAEGSLKIRFWKWQKLPADMVIIASHRPDITTHYIWVPNAHRLCVMPNAPYWWCAKYSARIRECGLKSISSSLVTGAF